MLSAPAVSRGGARHSAAPQAVNAVKSTKAEEKMLYPVEYDVHDHGPIKQATAVLNPAESKRLLA